MLKKHPTWRMIVGALRKAWRLQCILMTTGAVIFSTGIILALSLPLWLAAVFIGGGAVLGYGVYRSRAVVHHPVYGLLAESPERVYWVYSVRHRRTPFGIHLMDVFRIVIGSREGHLEEFVVPARQYRAVMKWLQRRVPQAHFGWTEEMQSLYDEARRSGQGVVWNKV